MTVPRRQNPVGTAKLLEALRCIDELKGRGFTSEDQETEE